MRRVYRSSVERAHVCVCWLPSLLAAKLGASRESPLYSMSRLTLVCNLAHVCVFRVPSREGNTYTHMMLMLMLMVAVVLVYNVEAGCATAHGGSTSESDAHHGSRSISKQRPSAGDS